MSAATQRGQKKALDPLELELWGGRAELPLVSAGSKLGSSVGVVHARYC